MTGYEMVKKFGKEYIADNGVVRICPSNQAKMNIVEFLYFYFKEWNGLGKIFNGIWYCLTEIAEPLWSLIVTVLCLVAFPITLPLSAYKTIKLAKREVADCERMRKGL